MGIIFNADEMFATAEQIERNGQNFYRAAAEKVAEAGAKKLLLDLADWEAQHEELFKGMRAELSAEEKTPTAFDPQGEAELYVQAMANGHVFVVNDDPTLLLEGKQKPEEFIAVALDFERDTILFFLGMKDLVPARLGTDKVDQIVREEMRHVAFLKKEIGRLES